MTDHDNTVDLRAIAGGATQFENEGRAAMEAQRKELSAALPDLAGAILDLFRVLPAAMIGAQNTERDRLLALHGVDDPRVRQLERGIASLEASEAAAAQGRSRAARALAEVRLPGPAFWGFVSDDRGEPLPGMTVRLLMARGEGAGAPSRTADDGYFRIALPGAAAAPQPQPGAAALPDGPAEAMFTVQFLDGKGALVYEDQIPLVGASSAYREYRLRRATPG
jgi:hypothetical protein